MVKFPHHYKPMRCRIEKVVEIKVSPTTRQLRKLLKERKDTQNEKNEKA